VSEVVLIVEMYAKSEMQDEAEQFLVDLLGPSHAEPGCLLYAVHRSVEDSRRLTFIERWTSPEALDEHMAADHMQAARTKIPVYFDSGPVIHRFDPMPAGDPAKGSLAGHAVTAITGRSH
jgi:quinol monooxygenase YgiN